MRKVLLTLIGIFAAVIVLAVGISAYVALSEKGNISVICDGSEITEEEIKTAKEIEPDCILVLGCAVWAYNKPSPMLKDRLDAAIELYQKGVAPKLLFSGDNSVVEYSEPDCMYRYALSKGVPEEDIFLDFAGFSTYESVYRARDVFDVRSAVIVSQEYHLFRALKTGRMLGLEVTGAAANQQKYAGRYNREAREVIARNKDLLYGLLKPEPTFLGDVIPITGDGSVTHVN